MISSPSRMAYSYPSPRTGTAQDLMRVITKAYEGKIEREGIVLPVKTDGQRTWIEPLARAFGIALAGVMELLPGDAVVAFHDKLFKHLSAPRHYPFDAASKAVVSARALAARLESETGKAPALLAAISHPPVMGDLAHLNFELVRHATLALRALRGRPCKPRLVVAVDPFALDTTSIVEEGLYAGFMGTYHLGIDRLALGRGHPGTVLSPQVRWDRMPLRFLKRLADGGEVGMVLSGGVPATGRVLYGIREWSRRARAAAPSRPGAPPPLPRELEELLPPGGGPWRMLQAWLMAAAAGLVPGETGAGAAAKALDWLGVSGARREELLADLARDLERETPARRRLFRLLAGRVARARPLIVLPVIHRSDPLGVEEREAWSVERASAGRVRVRRAFSPDAIEEMTDEDLAVRFTTEHFS